MDNSLSGIKKRAAKGFAWSFASRLVCEILQFGSGVVLARLLVPAEFGLFGMVAAFTGMAMVFRDFGIGSALVRHHEMDEEIFSSAFWFSAFCGVLLACLLLLMAPAISNFYSEPMVFSLCQLGALNFVIASLGTCYRAILSRRMDYLTQGIIQAVGTISFSISAVLLALMSWGAYALAWGTIIQNSMEFVLLILFVRQRLVFRAHWSRLRPLVHFGGWVMGSQFAKHTQENVTYLLVGRLFGKGELGVFKKAVASSTMPVRHLVWSVTDVLFPSMAKMEPKSPAMKAFQIRIMQIVGLVTFPACIGLATVAGPFVVGIYGEKWIETVRYLKFFCLISMLFCIQHQMQASLLGVGYAYQLTKALVAGSVGQWVGVVLGYHWGGVDGLLIGISVARVGELIWVIALCVRGTGLRLGSLLRALAPPLSLSLTMGASVLAIRHWFLGTVSPLSELAIASGFGACLYVLLVLIFRLVAVRDMASVIRQRVGEDRLLRWPLLGAFFHYLG